MNEKGLKILLVEDNAGDVRLLREMFNKERRGSFEIIHSLRMSDALVHLVKGDIDIVLLDLGLPDGHGLETMRRVHAANPNVPVIVLTGLEDESLAAEAMAAGAQDYLIKGQIESRALPRALRYAIERSRLRAEGDRIRADEMQFKDEFLSHVSHELRSPLTAIYQYVTILLDRLAGELETKQREFLEIVLRNAKQLQAMINDLLEVTSVQAGKVMMDPQSMSVETEIEHTIETLRVAAAAKGIAISSEIEVMLPLACADPTRVRQIMTILMDNAIKFTPPDGSVHVCARRSETNPRLLVIEVSDTGSGIKPDMTERVFERLFQAQEPNSGGRKGLGLGLYICKELVTQQGGSIWASNRPGRGALLSFSLPVFSLNTLIGPAVTREGLSEEPVTLVVLQISSETGWLSNEMRAEHSHAVRHLIKRCLHSDMDVVLPKIGFAGAVELFFIVAATDVRGGGVIARRIQEHLAGSEYIRRARLGVSVSFRAVVSEDGTNEASGGSFSNIANELQILMNQENSSRAALH